MATLIDGRRIAHAIRQTLPGRVARLPRTPGLGVLLIGRDPASELYVRLKQRAANEAGIELTLVRLPETATQDEALTAINRFNESPEIDAILVQLPVPHHLSEKKIIERIDPGKDVDGFHPVTTTRYLSGASTNPPALVEGIMRLIDATGEPLEEKTASIIAKRSVFTDCLQFALSQRGVTVTLTAPDGNHHFSTVLADIVIVAAGTPHLIIGDDCKSNAIIIDIGINPLPDGTVTGDVDRASVERIAGWITPVPGGVGPMTIAMLLENVVRLAERNEQ